ncbi:Endo-1,4-beta-xylanase A [Marinoscillum sp. 108]|nr:Endo-1,4-beta-xylanase A [Marinoscillum sp. 108]
MRMKDLKFLIISGVFFTLTMSCAQTEKKVGPTLRTAYADDFYIGAALGWGQILEKDSAESTLIRNEFSSLTPENAMKWMYVHPKPDTFNFEYTDKLVAMADRNDQFMVGHTLIWHNQTPEWVFRDEDNDLIDSTALFGRMKDHINAIMGRYQGKIGGYDVVNEALNDDGTFRESLFYQIGGVDFIYKAFEYAAMADPEAELYYNDYSMNRTEKCDGAVQLAKAIKAKGLRIDGIGMQGHWGLDRPTLEEIETSILKIGNAGLKVMITELDITVLPNPRNVEGADLSASFENNAEANPYKNGLPDSVQMALAQRYADLFELFHKHQDIITRVTLWGVHDGQSWKNNWPARGRTDYPLLFDRSLAPKPAHQAVLGVVGK